MTNSVSAKAFTQAAADTDEREAFERWYSGGCAPLHAYVRIGEEYKYLHTQTAWRVWQARAALAQSPARQEPELPNEIIQDLEFFIAVGAKTWPMRTECCSKRLAAYRAAQPQPGEKA